MLLEFTLQSGSFSSLHMKQLWYKLHSNASVKFCHLNEIINDSVHV